MDEITERYDAIIADCEKAKKMIEAILDSRPEFMRDSGNEKNTRPSLAFYHASAKGTGSAAKFRLNPAHGSVDGSMWLTIANQMTIGDRRGPNPTYPRFDWDDAAVVKLDFLDMSKILQVLRGETESLEEGKGLFHISTNGTTKIVFRHLVDPVCGYSLEITEIMRMTRKESFYRMFFTPAEACGICEAFAGVMPLIAFGDPATY